jgi:hypothetical protein
VNIFNHTYSKQILLTVLILISAVISHAQIVPDTAVLPVIPDTTTVTTTITTDTVRAAIDTMAIARGGKVPFTPVPKKAGLYSAIVPGMGQLYNRQYWKLPVIYAGMAVTGYFLIDNIKQYRSYRKVYIGRIDNDPTTKDDLTYTTEEVKLLQDSYKKYADLTVLFTAVGYMIQVMDAVASAHLKNFDISPDISMRMTPVVYGNGIGIGLVMNFK